MTQKAALHRGRTMRPCLKRSEATSLITVCFTLVCARSAFLPLPDLGLAARSTSSPFLGSLWTSSCMRHVSGEFRV